MSTTPQVQRGCGVRKAGGAYLESRLVEDGLPIEHFLVDPPMPVDLAAMGITSVGVHPIRRDDVVHVADWIGSQHYVNPADLIEECRLHGLSRRVPKTFDFALLSTRSRHLAIHERAYIVNHDDVYPATREWECPKHAADHGWATIVGGGPLAWTSPGSWQPPLVSRSVPPACCCAGLWWQDIRGGMPVEGDPTADPMPVTRHTPSCDYRGFELPRSVTPQYRPAFFCALPITTIAVVIDPVAGTHEAVYARARQLASIPVVLEEF
jgi:hypothetical protein